jgi:hypothetical protein
MDEKDIVAEVVRHQVEWVEAPNRNFGNIPVCPFARRPRREGLIDYRVMAFSTATSPLDPKVLEAVSDFEGKALQSVFVIHPDRELPLAELVAFVDALQAELRPRGLAVFRGHPLDEFKVGDEYTRREPYPGFQVLRQDLIDESRQKLSAGYYLLWGEDALREVGLAP